MASKKDNLPQAVENDMEQGSSITYANEVVATIAGVAASEVEGIASMCPVGGIDILGRSKNVTKGVKVEIGTEEASVDLYINVEYGTPIQKAAQDAQENVRKAIEEMTGLHVVRVDVHVQGVSFEKENNAIEAGKQVKAALEAGTSSVKKPAAAPKAEPAPQTEAPAAQAEAVEAPKAEEAAPEQDAPQA